MINLTKPTKKTLETVIMPKAANFTYWIFKSLGSTWTWRKSQVDWETQWWWDGGHVTLPETNIAGWNIQHFDGTRKCREQRVSTVGLWIHKNPQMFMRFFHVAHDFLLFFKNGFWCLYKRMFWEGKKGMRTSSLKASLGLAVPVDQHVREKEVPTWKYGSDTRTGHKF